MAILVIFFNSVLDSTRFKISGRSGANLAYSRFLIDEHKKIEDALILRGYLSKIVRFLMPKRDTKF